MNKKLLAFVIIVAVVVFGVIMIKKNNITIAPEITTSAPVETINTTTTGTKTPAKTTTGTTTGTTSGQKTFTLAQVATHNSEPDCYSAINGFVYDLTAWINKHPGGDRAILSICGKDGSAAYNGQHGGASKPERILAGFEVGTLIQ